jgi:hypothetical protein
VALRASHRHQRVAQRLASLPGTAAAMAGWAELPARSGLAALRHDDRTGIRCNVRSHDVARILPSILRLLSACPQA